LCTARAVAAKIVEPVTQIDIIAAEPAFRENRRNACGQHAAAFGRRVDHHPREPRLQRQRAQFSSFARDTARGIDRAELREQCPRFSESALWRGVEKRQLAGVGYAPLRQIEQERGQISGQYFGARIRLERTRLWFVPQAVANAGLRATRPAATLVGG